MQALDDANASWGASEALGKLSPAASSAVVKLTAELSSAEPEKRVKLAEAIWHLTVASPPPSCRP